MKTIVLSAFPTWENEAYNSSWETIKDLDLDLPSGWQYRIVRLPGSWTGSARKLKSVIDSEVKVVLSLGMTGGKTILLERVANNLISPSLPDINGKTCSSELVCKSGPPAYWTTLPFQEIINAVQRQNIACEQSIYAGDYLCNFIFYWLMHFSTKHRPDIIGGFIHTPPFEMHGGISKCDQRLAVDTIVSTVLSYVDGLMDIAD